MISSFEQAGMAVGYARFRPPVHRRILERAFVPGTMFPKALDVGCGAGVSTQALAGFADFTIGMEPAAGMLPKGPGYFAGAAEAIPVRTDSIDLITAAGSLNYADLTLFFPEAARVLRTPGLLVVYDFEPGRSFRDSSTLDDWFRAFVARYPWPPHEGRELNPEILSDLAAGLRLEHQQHFEIAQLARRQVPGRQLRGFALQRDALRRLRGDEIDELAAVRRDQLRHRGSESGRGL